MKFLSSFLLFFLFSNTFAQKSEVLNVLRTQQQDWNSANIEAFMQAYWKSDSLIFVGKKGVQYGWQNTLNQYKKSYPNPEAMGQLKFGELKISVMNREWIRVLGMWQLDRKSDVLKGYFSLIFRKIKGNWVIVYDHTS